MRRPLSTMYRCNFGDYVNVRGQLAGGRHAQHWGRGVQHAFEIVPTLQRLTVDAGADEGFRGVLERPSLLEGDPPGDTNSNLSSKVHACWGGALRLCRRVRGDCTVGDCIASQDAWKHLSALLLPTPGAAVVWMFKSTCPVSQGAHRGPGEMQQHSKQDERGHNVLLAKCRRMYRQQWAAAWNSSRTFRIRKLRIPFVTSGPCWFASVQISIKI